MTGRWMMASIQMTFSVMPAAIYWFGGFEVAHGAAAAISIGTLVAFTTLQTRLFAPIGSLLSVSVDVQSSLALFDRIFEYLDLPIDIVEGTTHARRTSAARSRFDDVWFRYARRAAGRSRGVDVDGPGRDDDRGRRRDGRRQDDARLPRLAPLRRRPRARRRSTASTSAS